MRKTALLIATALLTAALTACSGNTETAGSSAANAEQQEAAVSNATVETQNASQASAEEGQNASQASTTEDEGGIDVDKGLLNVEITIPAESAEYYGFSFESQEEADAYAKEQGFKSANITAVEHNDNYTEIKVTTESEELSLNESFSTLAFYIYGGMYNAFNGTPVDNIHIDFINEASGEVIDSFDSENMDDGSAD